MTSPIQKAATLRISEVRIQLNQLVNTSHREYSRVVVEKTGIPVADLVSIEDLQRLERLERLSAKTAIHP